MFYYYYDWTYILVLIGVVLSLLASAKVKSTFARYSNVRSYSGMTEGMRQKRFCIGTAFMMYRSSIFQEI